MEIYQYVLSKLPSNQVGFNNLVNLRKSQINEFFINLIKNIENSQKEALNFEQQIFVVEVADTNFFGINEILKNNVINTQTSLNEKLSEIRKELNMETNEFNPYRKRLVKRGIVNGEDRGYVSFTLPLFEEYVLDNYDE